MNVGSVKLLASVLRGRAGRCAAVAMAASVCVNAVRAQEQPAPGHVGGWVSEATPVSAEVVVVINDAAALRDSRVAGVLIDGLEQVGVLNEIRASWDAFASTCGWRSDEAFDRILGQRCEVLVRQDDAGRAEWALLSEVAPETDERLRRRLTVAPRKIAHGHQILSIEKGAYELASHAIKGGAADGRVLLVLAPAGRTDLFDDALESLSRQTGGRFGATDAAVAARPFAEADVLLLQQAGKEGDAPWSRFRLVAGDVEPSGLRVRLRLREKLAPPEALESLDERVVNRLAEGAILAVFEQRAGVDDAQTLAALAGEVLGKLGPGAEVIKTLGRRQAFVLHPCEASPGIAGAMAMESADLPATAVAGDAFMAQLVALVESLTGAEPRPARSFGGAAPEAMRTASVGSGPTTALATPVQIRWSFTPMAEAGGRGWWTVAAAPGGGAVGGLEAERLLTSCLGAVAGARPDAEESGEPLISAGVVRPRQLAESLRAHVSGAESWWRALMPVDSVDWRLAAEANGDVVGTLRLRLSDAPGARKP